MYYQYYAPGAMYNRNFPPPQPNQWGNPAARETLNEGNVCAYVPDKPASYHKVKFTHWPSMDYQTPYPKGFLHTMHTQQNLGNYIPHRYQHQSQLSTQAKPFSNHNHYY